MRRRLWNQVNGWNLKAETKNRLFRYIPELISGIVGLLVWLTVKNWALSSWDWMLCFIGYPIAVSWIVFSLYSCSHEFRNGAAESR